MDKSILQDQITHAITQAEKCSSDIILITGGPTCEDIDPVRFISNRSTGRMGIDSALAAKELGLYPILILGPTHLTPEDPDIPVINIRSASDLFYSVNALFPFCQFLVMSAAVADFTPTSVSSNKLKKAEIQNSDNEFILKLKRTPDILYELNKTKIRSNKLIAGFSLDTSINITEGLRKLNSKGLDLIVINSTDAFEKSSSSVKIITRDNCEISLSDNSKHNTAKTIITELLRLKSKL